MVGYRIRTANLLRNSWRKMGLPLLTENASQIWTTVTQFLGGERPRGGEASILGMAWDSTSVTRWKHKIGFHNREYNGTHRWQGGLVKGMTG